MKRLWLIRHAESKHNIRDRFPNLPEQDFLNTPLSDEGRNQARSIQGPVDLLLVSPLRRTLETYLYSKLMVKRLQTTDLLREFCAYGPASLLDGETPWVETEPQFHERVSKLITFIRAQPETNITLLSHGVLLGELSRRLGRPTHFPNGAVAQFELPSAL